MGLFRELLFDLVVRAGAVGHVEFAPVAQRHGEGPVHERRPGGEFHGQAVGEGESVEADLEFGGVRGGGEEGEQREAHGMKGEVFFLILIVILILIPAAVPLRAPLAD